MGVPEAPGGVTVTAPATAPGGDTLTIAGGITIEGPPGDATLGAPGVNPVSVPVVVSFFLLSGKKVKGLWVQPSRYIDGLFMVSLKLLETLLVFS